MNPETFIYIAAFSAVIAAISSMVMLVVVMTKKDTNNTREEFSNLRQEVSNTLFQFQNTLQNLLNDKNKAQSDVLQQLGGHQKERLENVMKEVGGLTQSLSESQHTMRQTLESRLDAMRTENTGKLDEIRKTVDEQLQTVLEKRLTESFKRVSDQLESVHKGLGEMQSLASGVGDLKKVLTNVKTRGIWGEIQLGNLLEQFLTPDQYITNAQVKSNTGERVEFAVRMPGRTEDGVVLLPIDAKFPQEDYERLVLATEQGSMEAVEAASAQLEVRVRKFANDISSKYISPPDTTDFAILFLPTESLYTELLRRPGFFERLQRDYSVTLVGPSTLSAFLMALKAGFRSLAIEQRSSEVWKMLGAVKKEFETYGSTVTQLDKQLNTALKTIETLGTRTRQMNKKLSNVDALPESDSKMLLGFDQPLDLTREDDDLPLVANLKK